MTQDSELITRIQNLYDRTDSLVGSTVLIGRGTLRAILSALREPGEAKKLPDSEGWWWRESEMTRVEFSGGKWVCLTLAANNWADCLPGRWVKANPPASPTPAGEKVTNAVIPEGYIKAGQKVMREMTEAFRAAADIEAETPIANYRASQWNDSRDRFIFDAGFRAYRSFGDNHAHYQGEAADRVFSKAIAAIPAPAPQASVSGRPKFLAWLDHTWEQFTQVGFGREPETMKLLHDRRMVPVTRHYRPDGTFALHIDMPPPGWRRKAGFVEEAQASVSVEPITFPNVHDAETIEALVVACGEEADWRSYYVHADRERTSLQSTIERLERETATLREEIEPLTAELIALHLLADVAPDPEEVERLNKVWSRSVAHSRTVEKERDALRQQVADLTAASSRLATVMRNWSGVWSDNIVAALAEVHHLTTAPRSTP